MAHVVFVGLGFGGLYTARHLLDDRPEGDLRVTAVDRRDRFTFTPLLYEYLAGELDPDVVAPQLDSLLGDDGVERVRADVHEVNVADREVRFADGGRIPFDVAVLAPGSVPAFRGVPGAEMHAIPFYSFEEAERLKRALRLREWAHGTKPACVVGGGVVGIELAFALTELLERSGMRTAQAKVIVLEATDQILRGLSEGVCDAAWKRLARAGIEVRTGVKVLEVEEEGVLFQNGERRERLGAAVIAWAAGIRPSPLLEALPAERHGPHGVRVERTLQLPGFPFVFVLGDAISYPGHVAGNPIPDTAQAAVQEAGACARNLRDWLEGGLSRKEYRYDELGTFLRVSRTEALAEIKGVVLDGVAASVARRAAYLSRLPAWAIRTAAFKQWLR